MQAVEQLLQNKTGGFTATLLLCVADLRDDFQHGAVLRDPQQPGLLEVQTAALKEELAAALTPGSSWVLQQERALVLLAGCSQLFEKLM